MSDFIQQTVALTRQTPLSWLSEFQNHNAEVWQKVTFPRRKTERWRYTSLRVLEQGDFFSGFATKPNPAPEVLSTLEINGLESIDLVFINGFFDEDLSTPLSVFPEGLEITRFATADQRQQEQIKNFLGNIAKDEQHLFVTLNNSQLKDGVFVKIAKNYKIEIPIRVLTLSLTQEKAFACPSRLFVQLEEGSEATMIEQFTSDTAEQKNFVNAVAELDLRANSRLNHYRLNLEHESSVHLGGVHANLQSGATFESFQLALGGKLKRIDVVVNHLGKGAHCELKGVYLPYNNQHVDFHTCIEHVVPNCTTNEVFRGIVSDSAKAVFSGRIHIHKDAQKTIAQLSNKNLLTSNKAEVDTKPELEIYADDVQCAHGATVAQLDKNAMHYLMTRGVSKDEALVMLSFGFINALLKQIKHESIAEFLRPKLAETFVRNPDLLRHLG